MIALTIVAGSIALAWTVLGFRLIRLARSTSFRFLGPVESPSLSGSPTVEAVVPARNEEDGVEATVRALRAQEYSALSITLVDDQSTDATLAILERLAKEVGPGAPLRIVRGVERPEGWVGKTWAVHQGGRDSVADWLWFVDADMGLHPRALASAMAEARASGADLVSLLPGVECRTFWQGAIAGSFLQLLGQLYPLDRVNDPKRPEAIAAGGFLLVRRSAYEQAGGHEVVRHAIIEDIQLAREVQDAGGVLRVRLAPGLTWTHMYGSFGQIWQGLRKNAYAGMDYLPHKLVTGAIFALWLAWAPWASLTLGLIGENGLAMGVGAWGLFAQATAMIPVVAFLRLPWWQVATLPAGLSAYVAIAISSAWHHHRGRIFWKDRVIASTTTDPSRRRPGRPGL